MISWACGPRKITRSLSWCSPLWECGRYSQILPCMLMSMARMMQASPGRHADQICKLTMAQTWGVTQCSTAAMRSSETALTGGLSIASPTAQALDRAKSSPHGFGHHFARHAPLERGRIRLTCWLIRFRQYSGLDELQDGIRRGPGGRSR